MRSSVLARVTAGALFFACCVVAGCGGQRGYRVSGKVTFQGKPVPAGKILFSPDATKGNTGPTGYADIKDGEYDTALPGGKGVVGGPMIVEITGNDPSAKSDGSGPVEPGTVKSLFPRYETKAELPKSETTKDFEVPKEALKGPPQPTGP